MTKGEAKRFVCKAVAEMMQYQHLNDVLADECETDDDVERMEDAYADLIKELERRGGPS